MKRRNIAVVLICLSPYFSYGQKVYDPKLKGQLDSMMADDQRYRQAMTMQPGNERDSVAKALGISTNEVNDHFGQLQNKLDSLNLVKAEDIIHKVGYPGKSRVGEPANETVYYVIQHSSKIEKYFPLIEKAGKNGELSFPLVAMMQDRLLMSEGKEQIYGTQFAGVASEDPNTHENKITWFLWPVKNYANVNDVRKKAGFKETIAENAAAQGIELKVITIEAAKRNYPWLFPKKKSKTPRS